MKSIITALSIMLITASVTAQQTESSPEQRAAVKTENMAKTLNLTEEQKSKVADLNLGIAQKNEAVKNNPNMTPEQKKEAYRGNEEGRKANLQLILTPEQYQKYLNQEANKEAKVKQNRQKVQKGKKIEKPAVEKQ